MRILTSVWLLGVVGVQTLLAPDFPTSISPYLRSNWQVEDGLPNNSVTSIVQSHQGYLWLSTFSGLVRFNGIDFRIYNNANTPGLTKNSIAKLFVHEGVGLWLSMTDGTLMRFDGKKATPFGLETGWPRRNIGSFALDSDNALLIGTTEGELFRLQDGHFNQVMNQIGSGSTVRCVKDLAGDIWISERKVLARLVEDNLETVLPKHESKALVLDRIAPARHGGIWVAANGRLRKFKEDRWVTDYGKYLWDSTLITSMTEDVQGNLWVGTWGDGLYQYNQDGQGEAFEHEQRIPRVIRSIQEDQEGNLWIGSDARGLIRLKSRKFQTYQSAHGLASDQVMGIVEDEHSNLWIANKRGGIVRLDANGNFHQTPRFESENRLSVWSILADAKGQIWAGTYGQGLFQVNNNIVTPWPFNQSLPSPYVRFIYQDQQGAIWVGTEGGLTQFYEGRPASFTTPEEWSKGPVITIAEQEDGTLWFGTDGHGLNRLRNGVYSHHAVQEGLANQNIRALCAGSEGILWIGGGEGDLTCFWKEQFIPCPFRRPFPGNSIQAIVEDEQRNLWLGSNRGVMKIYRQDWEAFLQGVIKDLNPVVYGKEDGLASSQISPGHPAALCDRHGRLWFATIQGLSGMNPASMNGEIKAPTSVAIEQVWIGDHQVYSNSGLDQADPSATTETSLVVPPGHQRIGIHFAGLTLGAPQKTSFRYRLEGLNPEWNEIGERREVYFQGLPPGTFHFHLQASSQDGVWMKKGARLAMIVQPAVWQTWWVRLTALLALAAVGFGYAKKRYLDFQKRQDEQESFARQLIDSQEEERQRIAAGLHDSLGQYLVAIRNTALLEAKKNPNQTSESNPFFRISNMTGKALDDIRTIIHSLRPEEVDRLGLRLAIKSLLMDMMAGQSITFESDLEDVDGLLTPEQEIQIYRIIQECVTNILKHAHARHGRISLQNSESSLHLIIEDDGQGFDLASLNHTSKKSGGHGLGLRSIKERVGLLGGRLQVQSHLTAGTSLKITIPLTEKQTT